MTLRSAAKRPMTRVEAARITAKALCRSLDGPCCCRGHKTCHAAQIYAREAAAVVADLIMAGWCPWESAAPMIPAQKNYPVAIYDPSIKDAAE